MKKLLSALILIILFTGCSKKNIQPEDWRNTYKSVLYEFMKSENYSDLSSFSLYDTNSDGIPELIISPDYYCDTSVHVYSFQNKLIDLGNMGTDGRIKYCLDTNNTVLFNSNNENAKTLGRDFKFIDSVIEAALTDSTNWSEVYSKMLYNMAEDWEKKDKARFSLHDINNDNIPELFISEDTSHNSTVSIYSFNNGLIGLGEMGTYGEVGFSQDSNMIVHWNLHQGYETSIFFTLNDNYIWVKEASFYNNIGAAENKELIEYKVNDTLVSYDEYQSSYDKYHGINYFSLGSDFKFTKDSIQEAIEVYK